MSCMTGAPWLSLDGTYRCFYCETPSTAAGRHGDPDSWHKGLRESHRILWSRPLPSGDAWSFAPNGGWYLKNVEPRANEPAEWSIGSDNFATTHTNAMPKMAAAIPGYENRHLHTFCTIGGYIVFPNGLAQTRATEARARRWTLNPMVSGGCVVPLYGHALDFDDALPSRRQSDYNYYIAAQSTAVNHRNELITRWWERNGKR